MIKQIAHKLWSADDGSTVTEYALIASLIAVALGSTIMALGEGVDSHYDDVETQYSAANQ